MSKETTISFIMPTIGTRPTLGTVLKFLKNHIGPHDEVLVVADGPSETVKKLLDLLGDKRFKYLHTEKPTNVFGNAQRDLAVTKATKDILVLIDDDDLFTETGIEDIRREYAKNPGRPHIFCVASMMGQVIGWDYNAHPSLIGNGMIVFPNEREKISTWQQVMIGDIWGLTSDYRAIHESMGNFEKGPVYHNIITYIERAA